MSPHTETVIVVDDLIDRSVAGTESLLVRARQALAAAVEEVRRDEL